MTQNCEEFQILIVTRSHQFLSYNECAVYKVNSVQSNWCTFWWFCDFFIESVHRASIFQPWKDGVSSFEMGNRSLLVEGLKHHIESTTSTSLYTYPATSVEWQTSHTCNWPPASSVMWAYKQVGHKMVECYGWVGSMIGLTPFDLYWLCIPPYGVKRYPKSPQLGCKNLTYYQPLRCCYPKGSSLPWPYS